MTTYAAGIAPGDYPLLDAVAPMMSAVGFERVAIDSEIGGGYLVKCYASIGSTDVALTDMATCDGDAPAGSIAWDLWDDDTTLEYGPGGVAPSPAAALAGLIGDLTQRGIVESIDGTMRERASWRRSRSERAERLETGQ